MMSKWRYLLGRLDRLLWARALRYGAAGVVAVLLAAWAGPRLPLGHVAWLGAGAVKDLLTILASSMLAVATFSLSIMVSAYATASSSATPRASTLLIEDTTAQRALSTFVGAFLYSIVGLIALSTGVYGANSRALLFIVTVAVIGLVVATLLNWIDLLTRFGRVGETIDRVEEATRAAIQARVAAPYLGGAPAGEIPASAWPLLASRVGYVRHVDMQRLQALAGPSRRVHVLLQPGAFADPIRPLARVEGPPDEALATALAAAFTVGGSRTFEQDPRFGLIVLGEIASRALSPAVNDPGTAIDVIGTVARLLHDWTVRPAESDSEADSTPIYPQVYVAAPDPDAVLDDVLRPIARDGAGLVEVGLTLQRACAMLAGSEHAGFAAAARRQSAAALRRAEAVLNAPDDRAALRAAAAFSAA